MLNLPPTKYLTSQELESIAIAIETERLYVNKGSRFPRLTLDTRIVLRLLGHDIESHPEVEFLVPRVVTISPDLEYICPRLQAGGDVAYHRAHAVFLEACIGTRARSVARYDEPLFSPLSKFIGDSQF